MGNRTLPNRAELINRAVEMHRAGVGFAVMAKELGVGLRTVWRWCAAEPARKPKREPGVLEQMVADGLTFKEIGGRLGISKQAAQNSFSNSSK